MWRKRKCGGNVAYLKIESEEKRNGEIKAS
jgi:hypothetical protein